MNAIIKALEAHGFAETFQGGGCYNYTKSLNPDGTRNLVCSDAESPDSPGDNFPVILCVMVDSETGEECRTEAQTVFGTGRALARLMNTGASPEAILIAAEFTRLLKELDGGEHFPEIVRRNAEEPDSRICHSHYFCDANIQMADAFKAVMGCTASLNDSADSDLWNEAWDHAKASWRNADPATETTERSVCGMLAGITEHKLDTLTHEQLKNFVRDLATVARTVLEKGGAS